MFRVTTLLLASAALVAAGPASIGTVKSTGEFRVDGSAIRGNSTIFEGNQIETTVTRSVVQLSGAEVTLLPSTRAKVYRDHTKLEKGSTLVRGSQRHVLEADAFRVTPVGENAVLHVAMATPGSVSVSARSGSAEVRNSTGTLLATLRPGTALAFTPQGGAAGQVRLAGTLQAVDGKYVITDSVTNVRIELVGTGLAEFVGRCVEITGAPIPGAQAAAGAAQVVTVASIKNGSCTKPAGGPQGAGSTGISGKTVAVLGGVAVAGTTVGLATAGVFSDDTPVSRR